MKFKQHSTIPIDKIKQDQKRYAKDIIQPRDEGGNLNPEYLRNWGVKSLNITRQDLRYASRHFKKIEPCLTDAYKKREQDLIKKGYRFDPNDDKNK